MDVPVGEELQLTVGRTLTTGEAGEWPLPLHEVHHPEDIWYWGILHKVSI